MDIREYNRDAWDTGVERKNPWTIPVSPVQIAAARNGDWQVVLTPTKPVPASWFPPLEGIDVLGLASGGGQQMPVLAAAGAVVTCIDISPRQLAQDQLVAERDGLGIRSVEGDMANLSAFENESFDLIFHPCSNTFIPDVRPVFREAFRVLRKGGVFLAGFCNPLLFIFDDELHEKGEFEVRHKIPYSDLESLTEDERRRFTDHEEPLCFGHTLDDQIGGQLEAGFVLTGFFEDKDPEVAICRYIAAFAATRAAKPE